MRDNKKNWIIGALLVAVVAMSVGYAALAQTLTINGTASIADASWNVAITNIAEGTLNNATTNGTVTYTATTATFAVDLKEPGASATYVITVRNAGTIDAILNSISGISEVNAQEPSDINFAVSGVTAGTTTLAAGATNTITVTVTWNADSTEVPTTTSKTAVITLNYAQDV